MRWTWAVAALCAAFSSGLCRAANRDGACRGETITANQTRGKVLQTSALIWYIRMRHCSFPKKSHFRWVNRNFLHVFGWDWMIVHTLILCETFGSSMHASNHIKCMSPDVAVCWFMSVLWEKTSVIHLYITAGLFPRQICSRVMFVSASWICKKKNLNGPLCPLRSYDSLLHSFMFIINIQACLSECFGFQIICGKSEFSCRCVFSCTLWRYI